MDTLSSPKQKSRDRKCYGRKSKPYIRGHPSWHFNLLMTTLRVETFKMNHSLQQIVLINAPESDRIVTSSKVMKFDSFNKVGVSAGMAGKFGREFISWIDSFERNLPISNINVCKLLHNHSFSH